VSSKSEEKKLSRSSSRDSSKKPKRRSSSRDSSKKPKRKQKKKRRSSSKDSSRSKDVKEERSVSKERPRDSSVPEEGECEESENCEENGENGASNATTDSIMKMETDTKEEAVESNTENIKEMDKSDVNESHDHDLDITDARETFDD
jgi:hypothetical protein